MQRYLVFFGFLAFFLWLSFLGCDVSPAPQGELTILIPPHESSHFDPLPSEAIASTESPPTESPNDAASTEVPTTESIPPEPTTTNETAPERLPEPSSEPPPEPKPEAQPEPSSEPTPEISAQSLRIAVISDLNNSYGSKTYSSPVHAAIQAIRSVYKPDIVLSTGDMVAGQQAGLDYKGMWNAFHLAVTQPLLQDKIPLAVTPGNHDASAYSGFVQERQEYIAQWKQYKPPLSYIDDTHYPLHYAFSMGPVLFVSLDATAVGKLPAAQQSWLEGILTQYAPRFPVRIIFSHLSLYPFAIGRETEIIGDPKLEQIFVQHGVTAHISGHQHAYFPGKRASLRLIGMACLGAGPRALIGTSPVSQRALLLLEVQRGQLQSVEAYTGTQMNQIIQRQTLPTVLQPNTNQAIQRDDIP